MLCNYDAGDTFSLVLQSHITDHLPIFFLRSFRCDMPAPTAVQSATWIDSGRLRDSLHALRDEIFNGTDVNKM